MNAHRHGPRTMAINELIQNNYVRFSFSFHVVYSRFKSFGVLFAKKTILYSNSYLRRRKYTSYKRCYLTITKRKKSNNFFST